MSSGCFDARSDVVVCACVRCTICITLSCVSELEVADVVCLYVYEPHFDVITHTHCPARSNLRETSGIGRNRQEDSGREDDVIIYIGS